MIDSKELVALRTSLEKINERLDALEAAAKVASSTPVHASLDRFSIAEAIVDSLFDADTKEKACTYEPNKPCDHCSMCSSRGF